MVIQGVLTLGALVAFNSYVLQLVGPMRRIGFLINLLGESQASAERVFEILDTQSDVEDSPRRSPWATYRVPSSLTTSHSATFTAAPCSRMSPSRSSPARLWRCWAPRARARAP